MWSLIVDAHGRSGAENMALDEALLDDAGRSGRAFLRLYCWDPPTLSFGRNEPTVALYDQDQIERRGIAVVRRPTGGKAVWHEHELTYAVAAPIAKFGSLRGAYRTIHTRLAAALRSLGADVVLASGRPAVRPSDRATACFASPVGGEILVGGRKLVGSAQVRRGAAFLQHGSILLGGSQLIVSAVSRRPSAVSGETTLAAVLGRPVAFDELSAAIIAAWGEPLSPTSGVASLAVEC
jgi:lipoate-protein ligase A